MSRVTGGSFPAQTWKAFMVAAHDTDNIPTIPGLPVHPVQQAEQQRLALNAPAPTPEAADANAAPPPAPVFESVRDMPSATRSLLEKLSTMLKDAPRLTPSDKRGDNRAEVPPAQTAPAKPGVTPGENAAPPAPAPQKGAQNATPTQGASAQAANGSVALPP
jgi:hypothetical protein